MNDGPSAGGQGEQLGFFHEDGRPALPPPVGNPTARDLYRFENLWRAYRTCRRTKRGTLNALAFERDAEANLFDLQDELLSHRYRPGTSICFVTDGPKPREVFAADFRDRIVHHLLLGRVEPAFERRFIHDSYACRKGRGVLAASDRLMEFLREATANGRRPAWALKLDVASFFPSISKKTLYDILCRTVRDPELRWLTATILFHDSTLDYTFHKGPRFVPPPWTDRYPVEARKSLFGRGGATGLPIGNLTSQFWANCYLNELDQFAKRTLGCRWYLRYVDDVVMLAPDAATLEGWRERFRTCAAEKLGLALRRDGDEPFPVARGIDFAGWKTWASHRVPRRRTLANLDGRLREAGRVLVRRDEARGTESVDLTARVVRQPGRTRREVVAVDGLRSTLASYSGHLRWGGSRGAWQGVLARHPWLEAVVAVNDWDVALRWTPRTACATRLWRQVHALAVAAPPRTLVFCPVGAFVEFRGRFAEEAASVLGLRVGRLARGQWAFGAGFPVRAMDRFERRALERGWSVAFVREGAWRGRRACRGREVVRVLRPRA
jgi:RNA-directed DNA polymerase